MGKEEIAHYECFQRLALQTRKTQVLFGKQLKLGIVW